MDNVSKEIKEYGTIKEYLPEAGTWERAATYRDKKIKPLFTQMKNKIAAMDAQVKELTKEVEKWKHKYQETKQAYNRIQRELDTVREEKRQLSEEKQQLQGVSDRYDRVVRVLGENVVEDAVQQDIQEQKALEEKRQMEQMPKGSIHERLAWGVRKSEMENQQRKKNKTKNRGMLRKQFLKVHRPARYQYLLMTEELTAHLNRVDQEAREQVETLVKQMVEKQDVTEHLKMQDLMKWVGLMNNIRHVRKKLY